jgi:hypothetical protein
MAQMTRIKVFGGIDWSQSENNMPLWPVCRTVDGLNFVTGRGSLFRRTVETPYAMPELPGCTVTVQSMLYFSKMGSDGNRQTWVMAGIKVEGGETRYDLMAKGPGYSGWTSIKGQNTLTSADFVFVSFRYEDRSAVIFSNGYDDVWQWDGAGTITKLAPIIAPRSRCMAVCSGRLWMASSNWQSVCCSAAYNAADWNPPDAVTITLPGAGGERITALVNYMDSLLIFTSGSIYRLFGHSIDDFELTKVCGNAGTAAQDCVAEWNGKLFFSFREIIYLDRKSVV